MILWATVLAAVNAVFLALDLLILPGNWLMIAATVLVAWLHRGMFSIWTLVGVVALALLGELIELFSSAAGSRRAGASRRAAWGAVPGAILGALVGSILLPVPVLGTLAGACAGACLGAWVLELSGGRTLTQSARAGLGAGIGSFLGAVSKMAIGGVIWTVITVAAFWP